MGGAGEHGRRIPCSDHDLIVHVNAMPLGRTILCPKSLGDDALPHRFGSDLTVYINGIDTEVIPNESLIKVAHLRALTRGSPRPDHLGLTA